MRRHGVPCGRRPRVRRPPPLGRQPSTSTEAATLPRRRENGQRRARDPTRLLPLRARLRRSEGERRADKVSPCAGRQLGANVASACSRVERKAPELRCQGIFRHLVGRCSGDLRRRGAAMGERVQQGVAIRHTLRQPPSLQPGGRCESLKRDRHTGRSGLRVTEKNKRSSVRGRHGGGFECQVGQLRGTLASAAVVQHDGRVRASAHQARPTCDELFERIHGIILSDEIMVRVDPPRRANARAGHL